MKKILFLLLLCLPLAAMAQTDPKYLAGAITMDDGKVSFKNEIQAPSLTREQLYETMLEWANERFHPDDKFNARVLFTDKEKGDIAVAGEEYIVFSSSALSLDRTRIYYQLFINCSAGKVNVDMTRIRYLYDEARDGGEKYTAEEWITDDMALNKSKTKLAPICGKFRRETINLKDELFTSIQNTLGNKVLGGTQTAPATPGITVTQSNNQIVLVPTTPAVTQPTPATSVASAEPVAPTSASGMEEQIKSAIRITITAGNDEQFEIGKECWGGFGQLFGKEVAFCLLDTQKTMGNMLMAESQTYKISFYQAGQSEPSVVISCKKLTQQNLSGEEAKNMNPNSDGQKSYNMYVGEVVGK
ncbi:MAG: DUF4468 domain-containing protein [Bacteroidales bacterium]|nr:DUF4468 domain-containing protein [Bacteroidales bacterium]